MIVYPPFYLHRWQQAAHCNRCVYATVINENNGETLGTIQWCCVLFMSVITFNQPHPDLFCGRQLASVFTRLHRHSSTKSTQGGPYFELMHYTNDIWNIQHVKILQKHGPVLSYLLTNKTLPGSLQVYRNCHCWISVCGLLKLCRVSSTAVKKPSRL